MSRQFYFFATKEDLLTNLTKLEESRPLKYVWCMLYESQDFIIADSIRDIDNLGINFSGDHIQECYLVLDSDVDLVAPPRSLSGGGVAYHVYPINNPTSIDFWPGGFYDEKHLIAGHASTINVDPQAIDLFNSFKKHLTKGFKRVDGIYVSPEVMKIAGGIRLVTISVNSPSRYDLKIPEPI